MTRTAENDGVELGYNECGMADFLLSRLDEGFPFYEIFLGDPPDPTRPAYVMNKAGDRDLYIKFCLEWTYVWILSFHSSKHARSD